MFILFDYKLKQRLLNYNIFLNMSKQTAPMATLKRARTEANPKSVETPVKKTVIKLPPPPEPLTLEVKTPPDSPQPIEDDNLTQYDDDKNDEQLDSLEEGEIEEPAKKKRTCVNICIVEELLSVLNRTISSLELQTKQVPLSKNTLVPVLSSLNTHKKIWSDILKTNERSRRRRIRRIEKEKTSDDTVLTEVDCELKHKHCKKKINKD